MLVGIKEGMIAALAKSHDCRRILGVLLILVALLGVLLLALCAPVRVAAGFDTDTLSGLQFKVDLFGGLISLPGLGEIAPRPEEKAHRSRKVKKPKSGLVPAHFLDMLRAGPKLLSRLSKRISLDRLKARIAFGFPDPADTGIVYGVLSPIVLSARLPERSSFVLQPGFERATFSGRGDIAARFTPILLVSPMIEFAWTAFVKPRLSGVL